MSKEKLKLRNFKADDETYNKIKKKAEKHTQGNTSAWLKKAGTEYEPAPQQEKPASK